MKIAETFNDRDGISTALTALAGVYERKNDFAKAIQMMEKSLRINKELGEKYSIAQSYSNLERSIPI